MSATQRLAEQLVAANVGSKLATGAMFPTMSATQRLVEQLSGVNVAARLSTAGLFPTAETAAFREVSALETLVRQLTSVDHGSMSKLSGAGLFAKAPPPAGLGVGQISRFWGALPVIDWAGLTGPQVAAIPLAPPLPSAMSVITEAEVGSIVRAEFVVPETRQDRASAQLAWHLSEVVLDAVTLAGLIWLVADGPPDAVLVVVVWLLICFPYRRLVRR
jgi:hypothetical protein